MVGIADTRQPMVGNHFAFLRNVRRLLGKHVTEWVVDERCLSVRWVVDFRAAVTHVVSGCGNIALRVCDPYKSLDAVVLEGGGNLTVWAAVLDGEHCTE